MGQSEVLALLGVNLNAAGERVPLPETKLSDPSAAVFVFLSAAAWAGFVAADFGPGQVRLGRHAQDLIQPCRESDVELLLFSTPFRFLPVVSRFVRLHLPLNHRECLFLLQSVVWLFPATSKPISFSEIWKHSGRREDRDLWPLSRQNSRRKRMNITSEVIDQLFDPDMIAAPKRNAIQFHSQTQ
jgi:hypothetical protein